MIRRLRRALVRLFRPLLLAHIRYQMKHSEHQVERLRAYRKDINWLERTEHLRQIDLQMQRQALERA